VATWCERVFNTEVQREVAYCHTFFGLAAGIPRRQTDHGYCLSLYATSPDGLRVEFTVDPDAVNNLERAHS
jgi:hypothetical protein